MSELDANSIIFMLYRYMANTVAIGTKPSFLHLN